MEEIKVGDYIRTNIGTFDKIIKITISDEDEDILYLGKNIFLYSDGMIKKHLKNLIDLIEAGNFVNEKIVEEYSDIDDNGNEITELGVAYNEEDNLYLPLNTLDIKTILTHEQYEQNCYKVEV